MDSTLIYYLGTAFLGGVILNVMPCVLPVLTMKVFHVVKHGRDSPKTVRLHGIAYGAGILATFMVFAAIVIGLKVSGELVGWGMQFQNPIFVAALTGLMVVLGLNAIGVFEFSISVSGSSQREGYLESFWNGVFASVLATPCSAPFLGTAAAFALGSDSAWWETLIMFQMIGVGLAFPFLLISFVPGLSRLLPRPGGWMESFKKLMGFTLLGAAVWLFGVLQEQVTTSASTWFLAFMVLISAVLWAVESFGGLQHSTARRVVVRGVAVALTVLGGLWMLDFTPKASEASVDVGDQVVKDGAINWAPFNSARVASANKRGRPVFIDFTADWCANCKTNEAAFIEVGAVRETLKKTRVLPMKADLTNNDDEIWQWVSDLGRGGIPVYVIYMPGGEIDLLPEAITTEMLVERLERASAKHPPSRFAPKKTAGVANGGAAKGVVAR